MGDIYKITTHSPTQPLDNVRLNKVHVAPTAHTYNTHNTHKRTHKTHTRTHKTRAHTKHAHTQTHAHTQILTGNVRLNIVLMGSSDQRLF